MSATNLWKYNRITGFWVHQRACSAENAEAWLQVFQKDEPTETFRLAKHQPKVNPSDPPRPPAHRGK